MAGSRNDKLGLNGRFWIEAAENARHAVPDEVMVVCVGGRLVTEAAATAASVDADHTRRAAAGTTVGLARLVEQRASRTRDPDA